MTVTSGTPELQMELYANKTTVAIDDVVEIAIKVTNSGTASLNTVVINEDTIGELFVIDGLADGESITKTYELTVKRGNRLYIHSSW